ncbi:MAG TPA: efflux RND transporter periplasmic adaptor subunit [Gemmataceae bacterium]
MCRALWIPTLFLLFAAVVGCKQNSSQQTSKELLNVDVSELVHEPIANYEVFTGRTQAISYADLRARVTGYLKEAYFKEGQDVKKDDVLFLIDPDPYDAALNQAKANLDLQKAQLYYNEQDFQRNEDLFAKLAVSKDDLDKARAARDTSKAAVKAAEATVRTAQINVDFTKVRAPFNGRISRRLVDPGNDVQADVTVMVNLVQIDPMYAYFDVDERTLLRIREYLPEGQVPAIAEGAAEKLPVALGYANEAPENFTHTGKLKFNDNKVDPNTGTLRMWGVFENPERDLFSGLFIRVRLGIPMDESEAKKWHFVSAEALSTDQGRQYLLVATEKDSKWFVGDQRKYVEVGQQKNGLVAVKGLKGDEKVVVNNLQRVRLKMEIAEPRLVPMPRRMTETTTLPVAIPQGSK